VLLPWVLAAAALPVPFVAQQKDTCGAAALAMVMGYWNQAASHDEIAARLLSPHLKGILGSKLEDYARSRGLQAVAYEGDLDQLREYVDKGRPLIVAWRVGRGRFHNVVVVGHDADHLVVHDPAEGAERRVKAEAFEKRWAGAGHWTLLVLPRPDGLTDLDAERYDEAAQKLEAVPDLATSYEGLVGLAVARGRLGRLEEVEEPLEAAVRLDPHRPEARIERGGLRFLQRRYDEATTDLRVALRHTDDAYTRDLLASSLLLAERPIEAVETWNPLGKPVLRRLTLRGLDHTRDAVVRGELRFREGERLDAADLRATLRALDETGVFRERQVRATVGKDRQLELELLLAERHGFGEAAPLAVTTMANLAVGVLRLRYANIGGRGISVGFFYRWEGVRPRRTTVVDWPRPFGLPAQARLFAFRETQPFDVDVGGQRILNQQGADLRLRRVLDVRNVAEVTLRWRTRRFEGAPADFTRPGRILGLGVGYERMIVHTPHHRLEAFADGFASMKDVKYASATVALRHLWMTSAPAEGQPPTSVVAARILWGMGSRGMPLDQMFMPGAAPDAEYPLRGHRLRERGVLGIAPIGRELRLGNVEWRREIYRRSLYGAGLAVFADVAHVPVAVSGPKRVLVDLGVGIRGRVGISSTLRVDYGKALQGRASALTIALTEAF
jgi:tetratricopeptide (TPR) repeat protein